MKKVLITGGTGFVGKNLCSYLNQSGDYEVFYTSRSSVLDIGQKIEIQNLTSIPEWKTALANIDIVVHLLGKAHVLSPSPGDIDDYEFVNSTITESIALAAKEVGVKKFIFFSSIGVYGSETAENEPITEHTPFAPENPYAKSKLLAEEKIKTIFSTGTTSYFILRPPLVYGPKAPGNYKLLESLAKKPVLLPLGGIKNRRSFIYVKNLCDIVRSLILCDLKSTSFNVADKEVISTSEFVSQICKYNRAINVDFPLPALRLLSQVVGKKKTLEKLTNHLEIDISKLSKELSWSPPFSLKGAFEDIYLTK